MSCFYLAVAGGLDSQVDRFAECGFAICLFLMLQMFDAIILTAKLIAVFPDLTAADNNLLIIKRSGLNLISVHILQELGLATFDLCLDVS